MSKTFKSAVTVSGERTLLVSTDIGMSSGFFLELQDKHEGCHPICFNNDTAPALALAILEAAGVESAYRSAYNAGSDWQLEHAVNELSEYVRARSEYEAEAEAQAKLEAEALELHQLFESLQSDDETVWLAVARRARELNKEEK